jgi:Tfp pilus assembly protein PilW
MIKREDGFTLLELMITMIMFIIVIASVSSIFLGLVNQFKQQSKIAETSLEGLTGLEILRQDLEQTGYGLPQNVTGIADGDGDGNLWDELPNYLEATGAASAYNDAPQNAPRAIFSGNNIGFNNSDYLVIKSTMSQEMMPARNGQHFVPSEQGHGPGQKNVNKNDDGTLNNNVRVITLAPGSTDANGSP